MNSLIGFLVGTFVWAMKAIAYIVLGFVALAILLVWWT